MIRIKGIRLSNRFPNRKRLDQTFLRQSRDSFQVKEMAGFHREVERGRERAGKVILAPGSIAGDLDWAEANWSGI